MNLVIYMTLVAPHEHWFWSFGGIKNQSLRKLIIISVQFLTQQEGPKPPGCYLKQANKRTVRLIELIFLLIEELRYTVS
jgi:hypothetical protein